MEGTSTQGSKPGHMAMVVRMQWTANESYEADEEGELSFQQGDRVVNVRPHATERGWSTVRAISVSVLPPFPCTQRCVPRTLAPSVRLPSLAKGPLCAATGHPLTRTNPF